MKNILIIEDWQPLARALGSLLESAGNTTTRLVGVNSYQTTASGLVLNAIGKDGKNCVVHCKDYQLAFVDGQIEGAVQGPELVKLLTASKISCCGMSSENHLNEEMRQNGAKLAAKKACVFAAVLDNRLSASAVCSPTGADIGSLAFIENHLLRPELQDLRQEAEKMIGLYLEEEQS